MTGQDIKVSDCCNAEIEWAGNYGDYFAKCSKCKSGIWPYGVKWHFQYIPSDYEKSLEDRIARLEKIIKTFGGKHHSTAS